jgi:large subunit ribosomal protein L29
VPRNVGELRELGDTELLERLESHKEELFNLRFQLATGQLDNPMRIRQVRHDVARILTVLGERNVGLQIEEEVARIDREALAQASEGRAGVERRRGLGRFRKRTAKVEAETAEGAGTPPAPGDAAEAGEAGEADWTGEGAETHAEVEAEEEP